MDDLHPVIDERRHNAAHHPRSTQGTNEQKDDNGRCHIGDVKDDGFFKFLLGIGRAQGFDDGWIAGAIISGAYFGDKISPLSDTTVLASGSVNVPLFQHIRYMVITTLPSIVIASVPLKSFTVLVCDFANWAETAPLPCLILKK